MNMRYEEYISFMKTCDRCGKQGDEDVIGPAFIDPCGCSKHYCEDCFFKTFVSVPKIDDWTVNV